MGQEITEELTDEEKRGAEIAAVRRWVQKGNSPEYTIVGLADKSPDLSRDLELFDVASQTTAEIDLQFSLDQLGDDVNTVRQQAKIGIARALIASSLRAGKIDVDSLVGRCRELLSLRDSIPQEEVKGRSTEFRDKTVEVLTDIALGK